MSAQVEGACSDCGGTEWRRCDCQDCEWRGLGAQDWRLRLCVSCDRKAEACAACGSKAWRWLDCSECKEAGRACGLAVCVDCGETANDYGGGGVTMGKVPTFEQVWPEHVPRDWWGPEWAEVVRDALAYHAESVASGGMTEDESDYAHEYADGWPSVYNAEIADAFHRLGVWAVGSVGDYVDDLGGRPFDDPDGGQHFIRGASVYLYAAARMAMEAVLRAAEAITDDGEGA